MIGQAFSPSAPINKFELFAGRLEQVKAISQAIGVRGQHAILYGERGVGKTSLVSVLKDIYNDNTTGRLAGMRIEKVNCDQRDTFDHVWRKIFARIRLIVEGESQVPSETKLSDLMPEQHFGPSEVAVLCEQASQGTAGLVLIFDEFDCLPAADRAVFAPTIKELSDNSVEATIVLVGVANDVRDLIAEHASVDRSMVQVSMPTMKPTEVRDVITKALSAIQMSIADDALATIVWLSQGFPHYAHLLGQEASYVAIDSARRQVLALDVGTAITQAIEKTRHTTRSDYQRASEGQRKGTLFPQVLLACALANADDLGYFSSADVRSPLQKITGKPYGIPNFAQHLEKLSCDESRGPVLEKLNLQGSRMRFRFRNPLLRPFILMKGKVDGTLSSDILAEMQSIGKI